jgi:DNA-binding transcriptional LysR family regulator
VNPLEWQQLEYFHTVARVQHFTAAAQMLSISQPALSRSISKLEKELGVPLFDREGRHIALNRNGRMFLERTSRILQEMKEAKRDLDELHNPQLGHISLAFLKSLGVSYVPRMVKSFLKEHPHVHFQLYQNSSQAMIAQLKNGEVDFCLTYHAESPGEFEWQKLWTEEFFLYVHDTHPLAQRDQVSIQDILDDKFIVLKHGYGSRDIFDQLFASVDKQPQIAFEGEEIVSALGFVAANLGAALLPYIPGMDINEVARIPIADYRCERTIGLVWRKQKYMSAAAKQFMEVLIEESKSRL